MLKQQAKLFTKIAMLTDLLAVFAAFASAYCLRAMTGPLNRLADYLWVLVVVIPCWHFLLTRYGLYASLRTLSLTQIIAPLAKVHLIGGVVTSSVIYFVDHKGYSRGLFGYFLVLSFVFLVVEKALLKAMLGYIRGCGYNYRNILVVGTEDNALRFIEVIEHHAAWGLRIVGVLQPQNETPKGTIAGYNVLGRSDNLIDCCKFYAVDEVVFCLPNENMAEVVGYFRDLEEMGINMQMMLDLYETTWARKELSFFHNQLPLLTFYCKPFDADQLFLKRCLDVVGAMVGLIFTAVLFPFIALAIKLDSPGPLFFGQSRVGLSGRIFTCWKFRSMYADAEKRKKELLHLNEMNGAIFKIKDDPRITRVGKFLRKTSLDELPQFWNVLWGEMSLVGTRPPTPDEVKKYENWHRKRICIKPGITGLWQVSGRNQIQDFDQVVRLDLEYIDRWTLWLDIKILLKTFWVVFARQGSC